MAHSKQSSLGNEDMYTSREKQLTDNSSKVIKDKKGFLTRYILNTTTLIDGELLQRKAFGEENKSKPHKTILLVGETGTGKSTLINAMVNYMLGVKCKDKIWCEIIETKEDQTDSQTKAVTVYDVFTNQSPLSLTIIDTPGVGSTEGLQEDFKVAESLHDLFKREDVHEINVVGLVVSADTSRLTDRQLYVFNAVLSLFGCDVEKNIVVLITHATKKQPKNAINAIKLSKVRCAKNNNGDPVYYKFDNSHCEYLTEGSEEEEEEEEEKEKAWDMLNTNMSSFVNFLNEVKPVNLMITVIVLKNRKQMTASIMNIKDKITLAELRKIELEQTRAALQEHEKEIRENKNFEYEVKEPYKEKVPIESKRWHLSKEATCCSVCEENCHYPGCWWVRDLSWCSVMTAGKCTVCTGKCDYTKHVKEGMIYEVKTKTVKKTLEDLKQKYERETGEKMSLISRLENDIKVQEADKFRLVDECYQCVITLEELALKKDSVFIFQHLDFLIEQVKKKGAQDKVQKLEELKRSAEADSHSKTVFGYVRKLLSF